MEAPTLHPLLAKQLRQAGLDPEAPGPDLARVIDAVDAAYVAADAERDDLGRLLAATSGDLAAVDNILGEALRDARESSRRLGTLIENSTSGIMTIDADGLIRMANPTACAVLGWDATAVAGQPLISFLAAGEEGRVEARLEALFSGRYRAAGRDLHIQRPDGVERVVRVSTTRIDDSSADVVLVEFQDVTERLEAQRVQRQLHEFEEQHRRLEAMANSLSAGLMLTDADHLVTFVNPIFCELFGFDGCPTYPSIAETAEMLDATLLPGERVAALVGDDDVLDGRRDIEVRSRSTGRYLKVTRFDVRGADGAGLGMGLMVLDVTAVRLAEDRMTEFVSLASHELMTPLTGIIGYAHLLAEAEQGTEHGVWAAHIVREAERLDATVSELLTTARLAGELDFILEPTDVGELLESAVTASTGASRGTIGLEIEPSLSVYADAPRLREVVDNLVSNAIKYSPSGAEIRVTAHRADGGIVLAVADRGHGIPPEDLPRIFERFFRSRDASESGVRGTGLGLYIVRGFVERMGGRVSVQSEPGVGSTFSVWMPSVPAWEVAA
ncbi:MAG: ATP-binding protein [Dehalococcoidia bacterium]